MLLLPNGREKFQLHVTASGKHHFANAHDNHIDLPYLDRRMAAAGIDTRSALFATIMGAMLDDGIARGRLCLPPVEVMYLLNEQILPTAIQRKILQGLRLAFPQLDYKPVKHDPDDDAVYYRSRMFEKIDDWVNFGPAEWQERLFHTVHQGTRMVRGTWSYQSAKFLCHYL